VRRRKNLGGAGATRCAGRTAAMIRTLGAFARRLNPGLRRLVAACAARREYRRCMSSPLHRARLAASGLICAALLLTGGIALATKGRCAAPRFDTQLIAEACKKGQGEAKKAMKDFVKVAAKQRSGLECGSCHRRMAPSYELRPEGLRLFRELGGR
jgi:hypothetical protein